jgi:hypothetical protein
VDILAIFSARCGLFIHILHIFYCDILCDNLNDIISVLGFYFWSVFN